MLVLLSFALVLAAMVLLVLGLLDDDGLTLIYLSIACSVLAAVVLFVAIRRNRLRAEARVAAATTPAPLAPTPVAEDAAWPDTDAEEPQGAIFPIADYDELTSGQILPLLPQLYPHEIGVVEAREQATKARPEILAGLAALRDDPGAAAAPVMPAGPVDAGEDEWFPIDDYESLTVAQIRPLLRELDHGELMLVRDHEMALGQRRTLLADIERRLAASTPASQAATDEGTPAAPPADEGAAPAEEDAALAEEVAAPEDAADTSQ